jgi:hypothetical protein
MITSSTAHTIDEKTSGRAASRATCTPAAGEIEMDRLPEELLVSVVSLTSPIDACRAAAVSRAFRVAADSEAVWSCFLPRSLPQFTTGMEEEADGWALRRRPNVVAVGV